MRSNSNVFLGFELYYGTILHSAVKQFLLRPQPGALGLIRAIVVVVLLLLFVFGTTFSGVHRNKRGVHQNQQLHEKEGGSPKSTIAGMREVSPKSAITEIRGIYRN